MTASPIQKAQVDNAPLAALDDSEGLRVLLVDDNKLNLKLLEQILKPHKLEIHTFSMNGQEALDFLSHTPCDAIFMTQMPVMDGYEAITRIRSGAIGQSAAEIPISIVSANVLQNEMEKARLLGVEYFVPKPVDSIILKVFIDYAPNKQNRVPTEV